MVDWVAQLVGHLFCRYNGDGAQAGTCYGPAAGTNKTVPFRQQGANKAHARNRRRQFRPRRDRLNAARGISDLAVSAIGVPGCTLGMGNPFPRPGTHYCTRRRDQNSRVWSS